MEAPFKIPPIYERPEVSKIPDVVVAFPTPNPPAMNWEPLREKVAIGEVVPIPTR